MIESLWNTFRRNYCPHRIYNYGRIALHYFDDRTPLEKICDKVDDYFNERRDRIRARRAYRKQFWNTYWDLSMNCFVGSSSQIRDYEKKTGYKYMKPDELHARADEAQRKIQDEQNKRIRQKVEFAAKEVARGRSYIKEQREMIEKARKHG